MSKYIENDIDRNEGGTRQLSADEIAAVLGTYLEKNAAGNNTAENSGSEDGKDGKEVKEVKQKQIKETANGRSLTRQQRIQEMKRRKKQQEMMRRLLIPCAVVLVLCVTLVGIGIRSLVRRQAGRQDVLPIETGNGSDSKNSSAGEPIRDNDDLENSDSGSSVVDNSDIDENRSDTGKSDKDIAYDGSLNVAGCYPGSAVADHINDEIAQISTLFVQTIGGKSNEPPLRAVADEATVLPNEDIGSENSIFIDVAAGRIMEQEAAGARISPASMTKILTILVAAEHITDLDDTFEITVDITDYSFVNKCSNAGFEIGEKVTVRDLFYGTVLPSGADAALGLAIYVAGSQEAFVELMNEKIEELGLSQTSHFTNCVGLYDENHYSTVYDIAVMLKAACDNSFCREVLNAHIYTTSATEQHPEGIILSNWFLRRIEDKDTHGEVLCAKTGFVAQSGNCAASLGVGNDGKEYICVTAHANSSWLCIYDHVALYQQFLPEGAQSLAGDS
ncbi:MAG: hypothetical protein K2I96_16910 [Lachnospiraceae bacterium]|nr:hypothetical protein [Lachnospiraceae bacterium]